MCILDQQLAAKYGVEEADIGTVATAGEIAATGGMLLVARLCILSVCVFGL